jgi:hypothetical protein
MESYIEAYRRFVAFGERNRGDPKIAKRLAEDRVILRFMLERQAVRETKEAISGS